MRAMNEQCERLRAELLKITERLEVMSGTLTQFDAAIARIEAAQAKIEEAMTTLNSSHQARVDRANAVADAIESTAQQINALATPG